MDACPMKYLIPIYLIVGGTAGIIASAGWHTIRVKDVSSPLKFVFGVFGLFLLAFFIIG